MDQVEVLTRHFNECLDKGMGDLETMLAGIWHRLDSGGTPLTPNKRPPGYRSQKIRDFLKERGARRTSLWGATAIRGDLEPEKKKHIIEFLKLVNEIPVHDLKRALNACADLYVQKVNLEMPEIEFPLASSAQASIVQLLRTQATHATAGKVQQGLVYALLRLKYQGFATPLKILTKRTHAGDAQSGVPGDIRISRNGEVLAVFEVKGMTLDRSGVDRILPAHGRHGYPLFILALDFEPSLKQDLNEKENTFAMDLDDYFWTVFSETVVDSNTKPIELLRHLIDVYNEEFCEKIEHDRSIRVKDFVSKA